MNSRVIDLTGDSSDIEPARASMPRAKAVKNSAPGRVDSAPKPVKISSALAQAINTMDAWMLKAYVKHYCETNKILRCDLEQLCLVPGKEVVRYHADTDSEDDQDSENEGSEDEEDEEESTSNSDSEEDREARKKLKPIEAADDEMVPRNAKCLNCGENFDVTCNERGDCRWHTGEKELDYESEFWADHDERCHGPMKSFFDDPGYADGFIWDCCQESGSNEGCKFTKHKAAVNEIRYPPPVVISSAELLNNVLANSKKRKAEAQMQRPIYARCGNCERRFDVDDNNTKSCVYHPGYKTIDDEGEHWCDWDEDCHGSISPLVDDPDHADGFMWSCCEGPLDHPGCKTRRHEA